MKIRTLTATLATSALLAGAAAGPAAAQTATYPTDTGSATTKKAKKAKRAKALKFSQAQLDVIAEELGTTADKVAAAITAVQTKIDATDARETRAEVDALLATQLGVTADAWQDAVDAAREATRPARADRGHGGGGCDRGDGGSGSYPSDGGSGSYPSDGSGSYPTGT